MTSKAKILVVEDEPAIAGLMTFLLTREGYDVQTVFAGGAGMELAITRQFDLILLDVELPGINGFDLCQELKQRWISRHTPIVLLSGNDLEERRLKAMELGAVGFIAKPFITADFLERVAFYTKEESSQSDVFNEDADANAQRLGNATKGNQ
jgi:two-component system alkaline phosphatase synthesis response regulator PhoP